MYFVNKVTKIQQKLYKNVPISFYVKIVVVDCHFIKTDPVNCTKIKNVNNSIQKSII